LFCAAIHRRADKPEVDGENHVSVARAGADSGREQHDPWAATWKPFYRAHEIWRGLLGAERFQLAELVVPARGLHTAATRVWAALNA
jgi:hypothetical protein